MDSNAAFVDVTLEQLRQRWQLNRSAHGRRLVARGEDMEALVGFSLVLSDGEVAGTSLEALTASERTDYDYADLSIRYRVHSRLSITTDGEGLKRSVIYYEGAIVGPPTMSAGVAHHALDAFAHVLVVRVSGKVEYEFGGFPGVFKMSARGSGRSIGERFVPAPSGCSRQRGKAVKKMRLREYLADMLRRVGAWCYGETMSRAVWSSDRSLALKGVTEYVTLSFELILGGACHSGSIDDFARQVREWEAATTRESGATIVCCRARVLRFVSRREPPYTLLFYRGEVIGSARASRRELFNAEERFYNSVRSMFESPNIMHGVGVFARRFDAQSGPKGVLVTN